MSKNDNMSRDILKAKFATKGFDLRDDDSLYQGEELVARDVHVVEENIDCIAFEFDLVNENIDFGMPITSAVLH